MESWKRKTGRQQYRQGEKREMFPERQQIHKKERCRKCRLKTQTEATISCKMTQIRYRIVVNVWDPVGRHFLLETETNGWWRNLSKL